MSLDDKVLEKIPNALVSCKFDKGRLLNRHGVIGMKPLTPISLLSMFGRKLISLSQPSLNIDIKDR